MIVLGSGLRCKNGFCWGLAIEVRVALLGSGHGGEKGFVRVWP